MGQYYRIINTDKKEFLCPYDFDNGAKLMEWSYLKNNMCLSLFYLLNDRWKGDHVYVVGDYAELDDPNEVWYNTLKNEMQKLNMSSEDSLYSYACDHFENISKEFSKKAYTPKYIYNTAKKQYIDLKHCPVAWVWQDKKRNKAGVSKINPLSLLLAISNNRGGGDFRNDINDYVGSWCDTTDSIIVSKEKLDNDCEEFCPDFFEDELISYSKEKNLIKELVGAN